MLYEIVTVEVRPAPLPTPSSVAQKPRCRAPAIAPSRLLDD